MNKLVVSLLSLFIASQILGIYTGFVILQDFYENPYVGSLVVTSDAESPANALFFLAYVLAGAAIMIILIREFGLHLLIFRILEFTVLSTASSIVFYSFLRVFFGYDVSTLGGIFLGLALAAVKLFSPGFKNIAAVLATAGVGVIFGISLTPFPVILFLLLLSVYDYISVFKTKHMVEFADFIVKKDLAFTVTAKAVVEGKERRIDLGTGDLVAPVIFEVSTLVYLPFAATVFVFAGALASLAVFLFLVWKKRIVLPALPPIVFGMLVFFLLGMALGFY